jgi:hypothetical protein
LFSGMNLRPPQLEDETIDGMDVPQPMHHESVQILAAARIDWKAIGLPCVDPQRIVPRRSRMAESPMRPGGIFRRC